MKNTKKGLNPHLSKLIGSHLRPPTCSLALEHTLRSLLLLGAAGEAGTGGPRTILGPLVACVGSAYSSTEVINAQLKLPQLLLICILKKNKSDRIQHHMGECDK
ncbi:hypothetical protein AMTRI_Chr05g62340 [Amborella trichopoda]